MTWSIGRVLGKAKSRLAMWVIVVADAAAISLATVSALILRFDGDRWSLIYTEHVRERAWSLLAALGIYLAAFAVLRLYRCAWRFASLEIVWAIMAANTIGMVGMIVSQRLIDGHTFPWSVFVSLWTLTTLFTTGERVLLRVISIAQERTSDSDAKKRVIILGGGAQGARVLRAIREEPSLHLEAAGFLDDDPAKQGTYIGNVKVLGPLDMLEKLAEENRVDTVIGALPEYAADRLREIMLKCRRCELPIKMVPRWTDLLNGNGRLQLANLRAEDLLRRPLAVVDVEKIGSYLAGRRVLITGAGGSIGSELSRQVASMKPASLVLLGHGENSIHQIYRELCCSHPELAGRLHQAVGSVSDPPRISQVFSTYRPQVVFHAAAHKHVPIMETNEQEAVHNNVAGTRCIAEACGIAHVERVVLISTDKAADPCCVMGATKWLCEETFRAAAELWRSTTYVTVRFGNVLGSRGSVLHVFCDQIRRGGPVTITHPEMTRYFMTIPEAVRLVLEAGAVGTSGQLYLLDMGRPVKITDMAKDVIRLCGLEPDHDICLEFTGIRPGEKLHEKLASQTEDIEQTEWDRLSIVHRPWRFAPAELFKILDYFDRLVETGTTDEIRQMLELVPTCDRAGIGKAMSSGKEADGRPIPAQLAGDVVIHQAM